MQSETADFAAGTATCRTGLNMRVVFWFWLIRSMWKHDVIHKTRSIKYIALLSEEDRAMATGNVKICEIREYGFWDIRADRQKKDVHADRNTFLPGAK